MPKISKTHGPTNGRPSPDRVEVVPAVTGPDETPGVKVEIAPVPDVPDTSGTGKGIVEDDTGAVPGEGSEPGQDSTPVTISKASTRRRAARG
jgi:hypothetical protein